MRRFLLTCGVVAAATGTAALGSLAMSGCGGSSCSDTDTCIGPADSGHPDRTVPPVDGPIVGSDASPDAVGNPDGTGSDGPTCDGTKSPAEAPCVIDEAYGLFVAPKANGGNDATGHGTKVAPYATLTKALGLLGGRTSVFVCAGTYDEAVNVGVNADGVSVFGGIACPSGGADAGTQDAGATAWTYTGAKAVFTPTAPTPSGIALHVDSLVKGAHFEDMEFDGQDAAAKAAGSSSIAVLVNGSMGVSFRNVGMTAGKGAAGANAGAPATNHYGGQMMGNPANGVAGGSSLTCTCPAAGNTVGGGGGNGTHGQAESGGDGSGTPASPTMGSFNGKGGVGGSYLVDGGLLTSCGQGNPGASGVAGSAGSAGAIGSLSSSGWAPVGGASGAAGAPGQGGGGGGGSGGPAGGAGGSGGGCGGCGGNGGGGGEGGGASIALALAGSGVTLDRVALVSSNGGKGGNGSTGEVGQGGGGGGGTVGACSAGAGGASAGGSGGGGGAGGPSVGIAWAGTSAPTIDGTPNATTIGAPSTFAGGAAGTGGAGGLAGAAVATGNAGVPGAPGPNAVAAAVQKF